MSDDVLCVRYSPDCKYVAASLLDNTVKIFFEDSLKFYLSLYGHRLPVMTVDFSSDGTLVATGSADKNIKLWGTDFGDCHKSIFAHDDSIMSLRFINKTHYFFTCSKDKTIKYWDADTFDHIQTISTHHGAVWSIATARNGNFVVSASADRSIRIHVRSDEQLFLSEERNREIEEQMDEEEANKDRGQEEERATKKTIDTIRSGERLLEALITASEEMKQRKEYEEDVEAAQADLRAGRVQGTIESLVEAPAPNLLMMGLSPEDYVLKVMRGIKLTELEESLRVLSFTYCMDLLKLMDHWAAGGQQIELVCRSLIFVLNQYHDQIASHSQITPVLERLRNNVHRRLQEQKDLMGINRAALNFHKRKIENESTHFFFGEAIKKSKRASLLEQLTK